MKSRINKILIWHYPSLLQRQRVSSALHNEFASILNVLVRVAWTSTWQYDQDCTGPAVHTIWRTLAGSLLQVRGYIVYFILVRFWMICACDMGSGSSYKAADGTPWSPPLLCFWHWSTECHRLQLQRAPTLPCSLYEPYITLDNTYPLPH